MKAYQKLEKELGALSDKQLAQRLTEAAKVAAPGANRRGMSNDDWMVLEIMGEQERRREARA